MTAPAESIKTVLELDLAAYSDVARVLEENLDIQAVKRFEDQIQSFVDEGLNELGMRREEVVFGTAGDNALLFFDNAQAMHQFAAVVHRTTERHNREKSVDSAKRWFRMGAATGPVLLLMAQRRIVGTTVVRAVRLESGAETGQLVVDRATYEALPIELQKHYGAEEIVEGKRDERFMAHRCTFVNVPKSSSSLRRVLDIKTGPRSDKRTSKAARKSVVLLGSIALLVLGLTIVLFRQIPYVSGGGWSVLALSVVVPAFFYVTLRFFVKAVRNFMVLFMSLAILGMVANMSYWVSRPVYLSLPQNGSSPPPPTQLITMEKVAAYRRARALAISMQVGGITQGDKHANISVQPLEESALVLSNYSALVAEIYRGAWILSTNEWKNTNATAVAWLTVLKNGEPLKPELDWRRALVSLNDSSLMESVQRTFDRVRSLPPLPNTYTATNAEFVVVFYVGQTNINR